MTQKKNNKHANRLINETSPYLLQHAHNPVDWYPWCDEAFERAKEANKPIFLSIGYSSCHWCHVMERESFEHEDVAEILNEHYISIKVDREERPDIDDIYMTATTLVTRRGGWPNSLWLTPDKKPFYAGTYYPRQDTPGMMGLKTLLLKIADVWQNDRDEALKQAQTITDAMKDVTASMNVKAHGELNDNLIERSLAKINEESDNVSGGFGSAPKFPPHQVLRFLINHCRKSKTALTPQITLTLDAMADGGIRDHIGGGFHRYSTDNRWFLPHFEKMLYDNAQLIRIYTKAYIVSGNEKYAQIARETADWVLREMTDEGGGFYSALDADSEGREGKYYLWDYDEIINVLGELQGKIFAQVYGIEKAGNYNDEATGEKPGDNIIHIHSSLQITAQELDLSLEDLQRRLAQGKAKLLEERNKRIRPHLDDKILADCNALMISGLAFAGNELGEKRYIEAADKAADFLLTDMSSSGRIMHNCRQGRVSDIGFLSDHIFTVDALLELFTATADETRLDQAKTLIETVFEHYSEGSGALFNTSDDQEELLIRQKEPYDKAVPSPNGIAALTLLKLSSITGRSEYANSAAGILNAFLGLMERAPYQTATLLTAADNLNRKTDNIR